MVDEREKREIIHLKISSVPFTLNDPNYNGIEYPISVKVCNIKFRFG